MNKKLLGLSLVVSALLAACDGDDGADGAPGAPGAAGADGATSLVSQIELPVGDDNCRFGGTQINSGLDNNGNGTLDDGEVTDTSFVCGADTSFQLQLLHFADVDGGRDIINNAVRFSAILDNFRNQIDNTVVLSSGDNWIPGPEYNVGSDDALASVLGDADEGRAHVAYLNALGVQASAFGNHEFDLGTGEVANLLAADGAYPGAEFPYLSANLDFSTDSNLVDLIGPDGGTFTSLENSVAASTVIFVDGEAIGVVGATTPILNNIASPGDVTIAPADPTDTATLAAEIQASVDALTAQGINKVILLAHMQQIAVEQELATLLSGVDIIVAGGSNTILADDNDRLRAGDTAADTYPLAFESASAEPVLVVNTDGDYTYVGRLVVNFDEQGLIITELLDDIVNGAYATDMQGLTDNLLGLDDAIPGVAEVSAALNSALSDRAGNVFGSTSVYLNGERGSVRTEETNLGNLTADANLVYAQQTDPSVAISLKNGGGIRAPIGFCVIPPGATGDDALECNPPAGIEGINLPGEVSQLDLEIALRFNNSLTLLDVTGAQLKELLEHAVAATAPGAQPGQFAQVGGIRFSFDPSMTAQTVDTSGPMPVVATAGVRIRNVVVLDDNGALPGGNEVVVVQDGALTAAATQTFRLVTLGFLAGGGDSYPFPQVNVVGLEQEGVRLGNTTFADEGTEQDALAEFMFLNFPADTDDATPSFSMEDTDAADDMRIQNLSVVPADTILN